MPRASWRGFLRLSLVSCPVYLSPATTRTKPIRLHQVWRPPPLEEPEDDLPDQSSEARPDVQLIARHDSFDVETDQSSPATRITIRPHDPTTGDEIEKSEVVKGYEHSRGLFVTFTPDELKALDVESSTIIDLEKFVPRSELDPVFVDSAYTSTRMTPLRRRRCGLSARRWPRQVWLVSAASRSVGASGR
jgi:DNA end-binding protein Ku